MNIHDIAREAAVSIATVSRVINNNARVHPGTKRRVQAVIKRRNYTPNALARGLLSNRTKNIGVFTVDILHPYYASVISRVQKDLNAHGYNLFFCNTGGDIESKKKYIEAFLENRVDGLIFVGSTYREKKDNVHIQKAACSVPIVLINNHIKGENVYCLLCDDAEGTFLATNHVIARGSKKLLFINGPDTQSGRRKRKGFDRAVEENGLDPKAQTIINVTGSRDILPRLVENEFAEKSFHGVITSDDLFANQVVNTLQDRGIRIPEDVVVIGYNNSMICDLTYPHLSSVDSRFDDLGGLAAEAMISLLEGKEKRKRLEYLEPRLVIRNTG